MAPDKRKINTTEYNTSTYIKKIAIHLIISMSKGAVKAFLNICGSVTGGVTYMYKKHEQNLTSSAKTQRNKRSQN